MLVTELKAKIKTKSNYKNLNNTWLPVAEIRGTRVSCFYFDETVGKQVIVDFALKEIVALEK